MRSGAVAQAVENVTGAPPTTVNVTAVAVPIPGWSGAVGDYGTANGCQCGEGLHDPDCSDAPTPVDGCGALVDVATGTAQINTVLVATVLVAPDDEQSDDDAPTAEDGSASNNTVADLSLITPTRTCTATASTVTATDGGTIAITLGVCDYSLPFWTGSGGEAPWSRVPQLIRPRGLESHAPAPITLAERSARLMHASGAHD